MTDTRQTAAAARSPERVMRLARLGSMHQCRLSFMRVLMRRMAGDDWRFTRKEFDIGPDGVGHAVYVAQGPERAYSLVAFAHDLPDEMRSDRVIATAWDATFALHDGIPSDEDIARLAKNVPYQEAGRISERELSLSRANRSVRLWQHVVESLAKGQQPDAEQINAVGYLMRTTAVYGSGKFGAADYGSIADRPEMAVPFQAEMLSVYLTRVFVRDLVNHMAKMQGGAGAAQLDAGIARALGIGNSTGLGLGPYIINHPLLFNNWIAAREEAIARVRVLNRASDQNRALFLDLVKRAGVSVARWRSEHPVQLAKLADLGRDLEALNAHLTEVGLASAKPWDALLTWSEAALSLEGQELVASLVLEPYGALVDELAPSMSDRDEDGFRIDGSMPVAELRALLEQSFGWAFELDWSAPQQCARAWYVSAEKLEPRLGERFDEPIEAYETPLAPARDAAAAYRDLAGWDAGQAIAAFLLRHPEHRHSVRRAQVFARAPYSEIRDNTISSDLFPVDLLRVKLAYFGATHFDPRSDRWLRITMFANAPYPEDLSPANADLWVYPEETAS